MAEESALPELVRDTELKTDVTPGYCTHTFHETPSAPRKEVWKRTKQIGAGGFGTVWLETCTKGWGNATDKLRAVKVLQLPSGKDASPNIAQYGRELETLAKFSLPKVCGLIRHSTLAVPN